MIRLVALDLDGTLLSDDGQIAPVDAAAIDRARAAGLVITIATGRLGPGTLPTARAIGLQNPFVCADGAATLHSPSGALIRSVAIARASLVRLFDVVGALDLVPFLLTPDCILGRTRKDDALLAGWAPEIRIVPNLRGAALMEPSPLPLLFGIGVGPEATIRAAAVELEAGAVTDGSTVDLFRMGDTSHWVVRLSPSAATKAAGVAALATDLGIAAAEVAVVGDWYNDLSLFHWAGRSFAMGQAPEGVAKHASQRLRATSRAGGGVAEAIDAILASQRDLRGGL